MVKAPLLLIPTAFTLLLSGCAGDKESRRKEVAITIDSSIYWCERLADTLVELHRNDPDTNYFRWAALNLLDKEFVVVLPWRDSGFTTAMAELFHVSHFDTLRVVWFEHGVLIPEGHRLACRVVDQNLQLRATRTFAGCHYHNGTIDFVDLDQDGVNELRFTLAYPIQSVPHIETSAAYYAMSADSLVLKFDLVTDERKADVSFKPGKGIWVRRALEFDPLSRSIIVSERTYAFASKNFSFNGDIRSTRLTETNQIKYRFDSDSFRFVLDQKGSMNEVTGTRP